MAYIAVLGFGLHHPNGSVAATAAPDATDAASATTTRPVRRGLRGRDVTTGRLSARIVCNADRAMTLAPRSGSIGAGLAARNR
jgi:hypothetical protein